MISSFIIDDAGHASSVSDKLNALSSVAGSNPVTVISCDPRPDAFATSNWLTSDSLVEGLMSAVRSSKNERMMILSASAEMSAESLQNFFNESKDISQSEILYAAVQTEDGIEDLPSLVGADIMSSISCNNVWPIAAISASKAVAMQPNVSATTIPELLVTMLIRASAHGESIRKSQNGTADMSSSLLKATCELDAQAMGRVLATAIDSYNIEELFPNFAWQQFSQESAAAAYHALAALFIRFGDTEAAAQCLAQSENLEESPRLFALKGLIQHTRGETLGAVANMVTSLQYYETRKIPTQDHYLSFVPSDLQVVASRLVEGLNALNQQDNDRALSKFSEAVFNFDSFYSDFGVESLQKLRS